MHDLEFISGVFHPPGEVCVAGGGGDGWKKRKNEKPGARKDWSDKTMKLSYELVLEALSRFFFLIIIAV